MRTGGRSVHEGAAEALVSEIMGIIDRAAAEKVCGPRRYPEKSENE